jgi:hypothetical protein
VPRGVERLEYRPQWCDADTGADEYDLAACLPARRSEATVRTFDRDPRPHGQRSHHVGRVAELLHCESQRSIGRCRRERETGASATTVPGFEHTQQEELTRFRSYVRDLRAAEGDRNRVGRFGNDGITRELLPSDRADETADT